MAGKRASTTWFCSAAVIIGPFTRRDIASSTHQMASCASSGLKGGRSRTCPRHQLSRGSHSRNSRHYSLKTTSPSTPEQDSQPGKVAPSTSAGQSKATDVSRPLQFLRSILGDPRGHSSLPLQEPPGVSQDGPPIDDQLQNRLAPLRPPRFRGNVPAQSSRLQIRLAPFQMADGR